MEPVLFFYSIDGTNTFGPVTEDALRQLLKDQIIGPGSFVCPEGETEWKPLDMESLRRAPSQTSRLPKYEPPPYTPTIVAKKREEEREHQLGEVFDEGPYPAAFKWGCAAFASAVSLLLAGLEGGIQGSIIGLLAGLLFAGLMPYFISLAFKPAWRLRACAIAMAILSTLAIIGQSPFDKLMHQEASNQNADDGVLNDARQQIAQKGYYDANGAQVQSPTDKMKEETSDDTSEPGRMVHASAGVEQELLDKVKVSEAAEKACGNFDPATLATQVDLNTLRDEITRFRAAQLDVLTFFQTYDDHCRAALASGGFSSTGIEQFVAGVHASEHVDQAVAIWQVRIKLTDDHLNRLDFLDKHWGSWQPKDGKLLFVNQTDLDTYNALTQNLVVDINQARDLQTEASTK